MSSAPPGGPGSIPAERGIVPEAPPAQLRPEDAHPNRCLCGGRSWIVVCEHRLRPPRFEKVCGRRDAPRWRSIRASSGLGTLQQFTNDKELLDAAIDRVRWYPVGRGGIGAYPSMQADLNSIMNSGPGGHELMSIFNFSGPFPLNDNSLQSSCTVGTVGALGYVAKGLGELPGRKSLIVLSDGFEIVGADQRVVDALQVAIVPAHRLAPKGSARREDCRHGRVAATGLSARTGRLCVPGHRHRQTRTAKNAAVSQWTDFGIAGPTGTLLASSANRRWRSSSRQQSSLATAQ